MCRRLCVVPSLFSLIEETIHVSQKLQCRGKLLLPGISFRTGPIPRVQLFQFLLLRD